MVGLNLLVDRQGLTSSLSGLRLATIALLLLPVSSRNP
jgi:hypothetical protein